jgi:DNA gyrase/topoisomerase IV subunit A
MAFENETASCMEEIRELENILQTISGRLDSLKQHLQAIEQAQYPDAREVTEAKEPAKELFQPVLLNDRITKTIYADMKKSLSLNDRFRFQRNLFDNNAALMDKTLEELSHFSTLQEMLDYLDNRFSWDWGNESSGAFREILEKRFT